MEDFYIEIIGNLAFIHSNIKCKYFFHDSSNLAVNETHIIVSFGLDVFILHKHHRGQDCILPSMEAELETKFLGCYQLLHNLYEAYNTST